MDLGSGHQILYLRYRETSRCDVHFDGSTYHHPHEVVLLGGGDGGGDDDKRGNNNDQPVSTPVILPPVYRKYGAQRNKHLSYSCGNVNIGWTTQD